jgi:hypothetical protein
MARPPISHEQFAPFRKKRNYPVSRTLGGEEVVMRGVGGDLTGSRVYMVGNEVVAMSKHPSRGPTKHFAISSDEEGSVVREPVNDVFEIFDPKD